MRSPSATATHPPCTCGGRAPSLAACRAVLFASLVDDPSNDLPEEEAKVERDRLFDILEDLVKWKNSNDENVLGRARKESLRSTGGNPPVLDPFCGEVRFHSKPTAPISTPSPSSSPGP